MIKTTRSTDAAYCVKGKDEEGNDSCIVRSAFQRREVLHRIEDTETGEVRIEVVGHWTKEDTKKWQDKQEAYLKTVHRDRVGRVRRIKGRVVLKDESTSDR